MGGDPINFADPFGLSACPPACGDVIEQLAALSKDLKTLLEVGTAVAMAPIVVVAAAEVTAAAGVHQAASGATTAIRGVIAQAELLAAESSVMSFAAGVAEGASRAFTGDHGHRTLPAAGPPPNAAWGAGRAVGMGLYYGAKVLAARYGITW